MRPPFLLLSFALVVVSHGDPTAFDDDYRPTDDTSTPVPTANSTVTPAPRPTIDTSRSGFWLARLARCKKASSRCVWTVAIFYFSILESPEDDPEELSGAPDALVISTQASSFSASRSFASWWRSRALCATRCTTNASNGRSSSRATRTAPAPRTQTTRPILPRV